MGPTGADALLLFFKYNKHEIATQGERRRKRATYFTALISFYDEFGNRQLCYMIILVIDKPRRI